MYNITIQERQNKQFRWTVKRLTQANKIIHIHFGEYFIFYCKIVF